MKKLKNINPAVNTMKSQFLFSVVINQMFWNWLILKTLKVFHFWTIYQALFQTAASDAAAASPIDPNDRPGIVHLINKLRCENISKNE